MTNDVQSVRKRALLDFGVREARTVADGAGIVREVSAAGRQAVLLAIRGTAGDHGRHVPGGRPDGPVRPRVI